MADEDGRYLWQRGGNYLRNNDSASNFTSQTSFTATVDYLLVEDFIFGVSNNLYLYKNGVLTADSPFNTDSPFTLDTIGNGFDVGASTLGFVGDISYVYAWTGRALNATDAMTLHSTPYGIFTGGGGTVVPVIMNQFRQRRA